MKSDFQRCGHFIAQLQGTGITWQMKVVTLYFYIPSIVWSYFNISNSEIFYPINLQWKLHTDFFWRCSSAKPVLWPGQYTPDDVVQFPLCSSKIFTCFHMSKWLAISVCICVKTDWLLPDHTTACKSDCCSVLRYSSQITKKLFHVLQVTKCHYTFRTYFPLSILKFTHACTNSQINLRWLSIRKLKTCQKSDYEILIHSFNMW